MADDPLKPSSSAPFDVLFEVEHPRIVRLAYTLTRSNELAQDITQDAFLRLLERWDKVENPAGVPAHRRRERSGCQHLDGDAALAFVRSRHLEELRDGRWTPDPSGDLGRISRQQELLVRLFDQLGGVSGWDPLAANRLIDLGAAHVTVDAGFTLRTARTLSGSFAGMSRDGLSLVVLPYSPTSPAPPLSSARTRRRRRCSRPSPTARRHHPPQTAGC